MSTIFPSSPSTVLEQEDSIISHSFLGHVYSHLLYYSDSWNLANSWKKIFILLRRIWDFWMPILKMSESGLAAAKFTGPTYTAEGFCDSAGYNGFRSQPETLEKNIWEEPDLQVVQGFLVL